MVQAARATFSCRQKKDMVEVAACQRIRDPHSSLERLTPHEKYLAAFPQLMLAV